MGFLYLKNKSGGTLNQIDTGLKNGWLNNTVINALEHRSTSEVFPLKKIKSYINNSEIAVCQDSAGTQEYSLEDSLLFFEAVSQGQFLEFIANDTMFERAAEKGVADGYASLDGTGRIPSSQLPAGLGGGVTYKGTWNANTNTPTLASGVGTDGDMYKVSVAGTTTIDGESSWGVGDQIIFGDSVWSKIDNTESITSVHGRTGAIVGQAGDYTKDQVGLDNVDNTSDLNKPVSTSTQIALDSKENVSNKGAANGYAPLDALGNVPNGNIGATLDQIMENGSTANITTPIDIQTTSSMNIQSSGAYSASGSSTSLISAGSATQSFYEEVATASKPNGAQITHGKTLKVTSDSAVYDSEMVNDSFVRKEYLDNELASIVASSGIGGIIGEIKQSILTEGQMNVITSDWVLADGRSVVGSSYSTLTGNNTIPDLRGQFLRGLDPSGTVDPDGGSRTLGETQLDSYKSHKHGSGTFNNYATVNGSFSSTQGTIGLHAGTQSSTNQVATTDADAGDVETRPKNVSVNYFIKIN